MSEREQRDDQLRRVAEGDVQEPADSRARPRGELLGRPAPSAPRSGSIPSAEADEDERRRSRSARSSSDRDRDERDQQVRPALRAAEQEARARGAACRPGSPSRQPIRRRDLDSARVRTRRFGDTDLEASEIGFGTWALGSTWWGDVSESAGERLLERGARARDHLLRDRRRLRPGRQRGAGGPRARPHRDEIQLSTKFGYVLDADRQRALRGRASPALGRPIRPRGPRGEPAPPRHRPRRPLPAAQPAHGRDRHGRAASRRSRTLRAEGKIRHYGVALGPAIGWRDEGLRAIAARDIASVQTVYNLLEQDPGRDLMAAAAEHGVGVMARVPTSSGLLDDNLTPGDDLRPRRPPPPPASGMAGRGPAEDRPAPVPVRAGVRPHDGPGGAAVHPRAAADDRRDPHDHQRGRARASTRARPTCPT